MIGDRIKELRKTLHLTQDKFAERIGLKRNSVAQIEIGRDTSDQTIFAICREFRVNEAWLRTGEGEMFIPAPSSTIDRLCEEYDLDTPARIVLEKFVELPPEEQDVIIEYMCSVVDAIRDRQPGKNDPPTDDDYRAMLESELKKEKGDEDKSEA